MIAVAKRRKKDIDPTFGRRLRALREAKGWTQAQLGEKVGMMFQNIARLEREVRDLRNQLGDRENAAYLAELTARHEADQQAAAEPPKPTPTKRPPRKDQRVARHGSGSSGKKS